MCPTAKLCVCEYFFLRIKRPRFELFISTAWNSIRTAKASDTVQRRVFADTSQSSATTICRTVTFSLAQPLEQHIARNLLRSPFRKEESPTCPHWNWKTTLPLKILAPAQTLSRRLYISR